MAESPREYVKYMYGDNAKAWQRRVAKMSDAQVFAIYKRAQEKLNQKEKR